MKNDELNLKLNIDEILKLAEFDNVLFIPVAYVSDYPNANDVVYIENDQVVTCHKDDLFTTIEICNEILLPISLHRNIFNSMPYPDEVAQKLYFYETLNQIFNYLSGSSIQELLIVVPSLVSKSYDKNKVAAVYLIDQPGDMDYGNLKKMHEKFVIDNDLRFSFTSPVGTHLYLDKRDTINIYDMLKYTNYIKLKGFTDNIVRIELEINKKKFDVFDVKKEISMFIKYFFGGEVWSQR